MRRELRPGQAHARDGARCATSGRTVETILIALALVVLPIALYLALTALDRRRRDDEHRQWLRSIEAAWETLVLQTADLRLSIVENRPCLHGVAGNARFKVYVTADDASPGRVAIEAQAALPQGFTLFLAPAFAASSTWTTGDADFDAAFLVSTSDESLAASLLTESVRAALLSLTLQDLRATATSLSLTTAIDPCALDRAALASAREVIAAFAGSSAPEAAQG